MPFVPIQENAIAIDLSPRFPSTSTVLNSPIAAAAETIIASLNVPDFGSTTIVSNIRLEGFAAFTVGASGTAATLRIRQTNAAGNVVATTGALTVTAASLVSPLVLGSDATPGVGVYVMTLTITAGAGNTTISAVHLAACMF